MTSVLSLKDTAVPQQEFVFTSAEKRVKLSPSQKVTTNWAPKRLTRECAAVYRTAVSSTMHIISEKRK